ncbi:MAG: hypothetical protein UT32_C0028G0009 [Parcubacteria group bacterium GW2011_GWC2_39_14]|nr:MAG: hypothetical protein UT32_C0028G0009 [Parcubacteria group bacterium GW2011_GWC2_39_14]KKR53505.1 MAG: hypothetical protein UT91_C0026G0009 [Parcubacteria group bacterium GW2011_GWA2_40_23]
MEALIVRGNFPRRRAVVGWIWLVYGLACYAIGLLFVSSGYTGYSFLTILYIISFYVFLLLSAMNKLLRITHWYSRVYLNASWILAFCTIFLGTIIPDKAEPILLIEGTPLVLLCLSAVIWIIGWAVVDILDLKYAPKKTSSNAI